MTTPKRSKSARARRSLDARFRADSLRDFGERPEGGWIREIRDALGMSSGELAARMGIAQPTLSELERSECSDGARLASLRRAAEALDCILVYAFVPRSSLEKTMYTQAMALAADDVGPAAADVASHAERIDHVAARLIAGSPLWGRVPED